MEVTTVDWIAVAVIAVCAFGGLRRGFIATALSLGGVVAGAIIGARIARHLLHNGSLSPYTPAIALVGAVIGASLLSGIGSMVGASARKALFVVPPLRLVDSAGGALAGAAVGLVLVWVGAAVATQIPDQPKIRQEVLQSEIVQRVNRIAAPRTVLHAFARFDPLPSLAGPTPPLPAPNTRVLESAAVKAVKRSVVRITATACGFGVEGSGWVARPHLVVTAAHVVAGGSGIRAQGHAATALVVDRAHDVAVLRVPGLNAVPLPTAYARDGSIVAILGYPENGAFDARPGRVGTTAVVIDDGKRREVTALSGLIRHGNSGGPAVDEHGNVVATIFAARIGTAAGFGVPTAQVRADLAKARKPVSTGQSCG
jgi:S1-C subfamily serine protease